MRKIIVATSNKGKLKEIKEIFSDYQVLSSKEAGYNVDVNENAKTFAGNALKKAKALAKASGEICIGDDSGIMIDAYNGWPGVRTARWMKGTDHERNLAIIENMRGIPKEERTVHWVTAIALVKDGKTFVETYVLDGKVAEETRGYNGFGFDEIFELEDGRTLAELSDKEKNAIGARKKALNKIKKYM